APRHLRRAESRIDAVVDDADAFARDGEMLDDFPGDGLGGDDHALGEARRSQLPREVPGSRRLLRPRVQHGREIVDRQHHAAARGAALIPTSSKGPEGVAPEGPQVHAVVLTWNGAHLLPECLAALRGQDSRARVHLVVVDNASSDGTGPLLAREFPEVEHLRLTENAGYARANNQAMRRALDAGAE